MQFWPRTDVETILAEALQGNGVTLASYGEFKEEPSDEDTFVQMDIRCVPRYMQRFGQHILQTQAILEFRRSSAFFSNPEIVQRYGDNHGIIPPFDICTRGQYRLEMRAASDLSLLGYDMSVAGKLPLEKIDQESIRRAMRRKNLGYLCAAYNAFAEEQEQLERDSEMPFAVWLGLMVHGTQKPLASDQYSPRIDWN